MVVCTEMIFCVWPNSVFNPILAYCWICIHSFKKFLPHWTTLHFCSIPAGLWLLVNSLNVCSIIIPSISKAHVQNMPKICKKLFDKMFDLNYSFKKNSKVQTKLSSKAYKVQDSALSQNQVKALFFSKSLSNCADPIFSSLCWLCGCFVVWWVLNLFVCFVGSFVLVWVFFSNKEKNWKKNALA